MERAPDHAASGRIGRIAAQHWSRRHSLDGILSTAFSRRHSLAAGLGWQPGTNSSWTSRSVPIFAVHSLQPVPVKSQLVV